MCVIEIYLKTIRLSYKVNQPLPIDILSESEQNVFYKSNLDHIYEMY